MRARWEQFEAFLNGRAVRERVLVFVAVAAVIGTVVVQLVLEPMTNRLERLGQQTDTVQSETAALRQQMAKLRGPDFQRERKRLRQQREDLRGRISEQRDALQEKVGQFIRPAHLMAFFEDLLLARNAGRVRVKKFAGLEREALSLGQEGETVSDIRLFRKGVEVVVETDYASTLRFLEQIEGLPWAVQVSSLDYKVVGYPRAELALTAHTFLLETAGGANGE